MDTQPLQKEKRHEEAARQAAREQLLREPNSFTFSKLEKQGQELARLRVSQDRAKDRGDTT